MIRGPGVVSARLRPTAISDALSQPNRITAAWFTYARTAYAPPNVTNDAIVKKTASWARTLPDPAASATATSGTSQTASPIASTRAVRPHDGGTRSAWRRSVAPSFEPGNHVPAIRPTAPAPSTTTGNGTPKTNRARKAPIARITRIGCPSARPAILSRAAATIPTTAHARPSKTLAIQVTSPWTAKTHESATISANAG